MLRDSRIESLMVIGYNPSHSNINSEVNTPFKILSILLRFLDNEKNGLQGKPAPVTGDIDPYENHGGSFGGYQMQRRNDFMGGERLDTVEGYNDLYDEEQDDDSEQIEMRDDSDGEGLLLDGDN